MPSTSKKQHNLMAAVAHNPAFAKKVGIKQSVGQEFVKADKGKKFGTGGRADIQKVNKPKTDHGRLAVFEGGGIMKEDSAAYKAKEKRHVAAMQKAGIKGKVLAEEKAEAGMKHGGKVKKYAAGGCAPSAMGKVVAGGKRAHGEHTVQQKGHTKAKQVMMKKGGKC